MSLEARVRELEAKQGIKLHVTSADSVVATTHGINPGLEQRLLLALEREMAANARADKLEAENIVLRAALEAGSCVKPTVLQVPNEPGPERPIQNTAIDVSVLDAVKKTLVSLPSLANCPLVNDLMRSVANQLTATGAAAFMSSRFIYMVLRGHVLDKCTILERHKAIETITWMTSQNLNRMKAICHTFVGNPLENGLSDPVAIAASLDALNKKHNGHVIPIRDMFLRIPAFRSNVSFVNEYCLMLFVRAPVHPFLLPTLNLADKLGSIK
ncbi:hypothetical protein HDU83_008973 [Entophlyctis luteolus]|nr:hypothetical protein HDU83_008973 [Entophlyctis luteolus]